MRFTAIALCILCLSTWNSVLFQKVVWISEFKLGGLHCSYKCKVLNSNFIFVHEVLSHFICCTYHYKCDSSVISINRFASFNEVLPKLNTLRDQACPKYALHNTSNNQALKCKTLGGVVMKANVWRGFTVFAMFLNYAHLQYQPKKRWCFRSVPTHLSGNRTPVITESERNGKATAVGGARYFAVLYK